MARRSECADASGQDLGESERLMFVYECETNTIVIHVSSTAVNRLLGKASKNCGNTTLLESVTA